MAQISKKRKAANGKVDAGKFYTLNEAMSLVKEVNLTKFDASVDVHVRLGVDPRKADQAIRGTVTLPNGTGKTKRVLVLCTPDKEQEAKDAGADHIGLDDYIKKIEEGWTDIDVIVAMPTVMAKIGKIGRILGPRGLMPNPKTGTVTTDVGKTVQAFKAGRVEYRNDRYGNIHVPIGRVSFEPDQLLDNLAEIASELRRVKPAASKGRYMRKIAVSSTMGPGIKIDPSALEDLLKARR